MGPQTTEGIERLIIPDRARCVKFVSDFSYSKQVWCLYSSGISHREVNTSASIDVGSTRRKIYHSNTRGNLPLYVVLENANKSGIFYLQYFRGFKYLVMVCIFR